MATDPQAQLRRFGPWIILAIGTAMLWRSWRKWPDLLVDFGQQLYLAWQMNEGRTLYEDLVCNYGPLAPYANAWSFQCFGASFMTLAGLNLLVFLGIATLVYRLLLRVGTPWSALVGGVLLVLVFGFSQLSRQGNYNYAAPYENSLTLGLLPALAAVWLVLRHLQSDRGRLLTGIFLGLSFLSKPEVFLAGAAGVGAAWLAAAWVGRWPASRILGTLAWTLCGLLIPLAVAIGLLAAAMDLGTAVSGALGSWPALFGSAAAELKFYRRGMGVDALDSNLTSIAITGSCWLGASLLACASGAAASWIKNRFRLLLAGGILLLVGYAGMWIPIADWHRAPRPLQFLMLILAGLAIRRLRQLRGTSSTNQPNPATQQQIARLAFAAFAGALLLKMIFNVRVYHYGFVLAMPAGLLAATVLVDWWPRYIQQRGGQFLPAAAVGVALLAGFCRSQWQVSSFELSLKTVPIGDGADRMLADNRAHFVKPALALIEQLKPKTLAVFPEGTIFNFLSRCPNPTPFYNFVPTGYAIFGEPRILDAIKATPPDVIVLVEKDTSEFGPRYFGTDYAQQTGQWIMQNYVVARVFGKPPLRTGEFGIVVLRRRQ